MIIGEGANFAAYAYAPAILVTPLGALSIIVRYVTNVAFIIAEEFYLEKALFSFKNSCITFLCSAVLAHFILKERLHIFGIVGCVLCLVGSVSIVLHAPLERKIESVMDVWYLATEPGNFSNAISATFFHFLNLAFRLLKNFRSKIYMLVNI